MKPLNLPLRCSPAALAKVVRLAHRYDPDEALRERAEELAGEAFDACDLKVRAWLTDERRADEMRDLAYSALAEDSDAINSARDRLREWYAVDMACDYYDAVEDEIEREADERDEDYAARYDFRGDSQ